MILCEGGMHFLMSVFPETGQVYGEAGLPQFLCYSDVHAAGCVQKFSQEKHFIEF